MMDISWMLRDWMRELEYRVEEGREGVVEVRHRERLVARLTGEISADQVVAAVEADWRVQVMRHVGEIP